MSDQPLPDLNTLPPAEWHPRRTPEAVYFDGVCTQLGLDDDAPVIVTAASPAVLERFCTRLGFRYDALKLNRAVLSVPKKV